MNVLDALVSRKGRVFIAVWAFGVFLLLFVSIAGFLCFRALRQLLFTTFRLETVGENTRLTLRPPSGFWKTTHWCTINAANTALAVAGLLYLRESVLLLMLS